MAWVKGQSGNPAGRPKGKTLAEQCRGNSRRIVQRLVHWLEQDEDPRASIRAAEILLDRAYGKPVLPAADGDGHAALAMNLTGVSYDDLLLYESVMSRLLARSANVDDEEDGGSSDN